jgi:uncharacterized alpha-E superfamily protein
MFWIGRYAERTEDLLRLLLAAQPELDQPGAYTAGVIADTPRVLLDALGNLAGLRSLDPEAEFRSLLLDAKRTGSAAHSIARLRDAMEGVRDQLSGDTWRVFANIDRATRACSSAHPHRTAESGGRMLAAMLSLYGVTANMIRDTGWHMIEAGATSSAACSCANCSPWGSPSGTMPARRRACWRRCCWHPRAS